MATVSLSPTLTSELTSLTTDPALSPATYTNPADPTFDTLGGLSPAAGSDNTWLYILIGVGATAGIAAAFLL
jgi:hypothetical protein